MMKEFKGDFLAIGLDCKGAKQNYLDATTNVARLNVKLVFSVLIFLGKSIVGIHTLLYYGFGKCNILKFIQEFRPRKKPP